MMLGASAFWSTSRRIALGVALALAGCPHSDDPTMFDGAADAGDGADALPIDAGPGAPVQVRVGREGEPVAGAQVTVLSPEVRLLDAVTGPDGTVTVQVPLNGTVSVNIGALDQFFFRNLRPPGFIDIRPPRSPFGGAAGITTFRFSGDTGGVASWQVLAPCSTGSPPEVILGNPIEVRFPAASCPGAASTTPAVVARDGSGRPLRYTSPPQPVDLTVGATYDLPALHPLDPVALTLTGGSSPFSGTATMEMYRDDAFRAPAQLAVGDDGLVTGEVIAIGTASRIDVTSGGLTRTVIDGPPRLAGTLDVTPPSSMEPLPSNVVVRADVGAGNVREIRFEPPLAGSAEGVAVVLGNFGGVRVYITSVFLRTGFDLTSAENTLLRATLPVGLVSWRGETTSFGSAFTVDRLGDDLYRNIPSGGTAMWSSSRSWTIIAP